MNGVRIVATGAIVQAFTLKFVADDSVTTADALAFPGEGFEICRTRRLTILLQCLERGL
jgi:hypothetical protein